MNLNKTMLHTVCTVNSNKLSVNRYFNNASKNNSNKNSRFHFKRFRKLKFFVAKLLLLLSWWRKTDLGWQHKFHQSRCHSNQRLQSQLCASEPISRNLQGVKEGGHPGSRYDGRRSRHQLHRWLRYTPSNRSIYWRRFWMSLTLGVCFVLKLFKDKNVTF